jgi:UDP-glucose 4-epimerase
MSRPVLITGISGALGKKVALLLRGEGRQIIGVDSRPWPDKPKDIEVLAVDLRKRAGEDLFRQKRPGTVIHLATVSYLQADKDERYRTNLGGTRSVFDHCAHWGVDETLFVSRHTYYGAAADAPLYHTEDDPPLAVASFPELSDLVAADLFAASALWRLPQLHTSVLRICYTLGASRTGTLASTLKGKRVPAVFGFDPLYQVMHEDDAAKAIAGVVGKKLRGTFNVAGPPPLPFSVLIQLAGRTRVSMLEPIAVRMLGRFGFPRLPRAAINHLKYPVVIDDAAFRKATGFVHDLDAEQAIGAFRYASLV